MRGVPIWQGFWHQYFKDTFVNYFNVGLNVGLYFNNLYKLLSLLYKIVIYGGGRTYYDDFDIEVLEKLNDLNFNLDINNLKKKFGILPISVELALIIKRLIAPYINDYKFYKKYNDLYEDIEDDNSFNLAYRCKIK